MSAVVVGLDLSLTSTGYAVIDADNTPHVRTGTIVSKGAKDATLRQRSDRSRSLLRKVLDVALRADLVVIEGPSFGQSRQSGTHDRAGLWWLVVDELLHSGLSAEVVEVPPATLKTYATGKGNASKDQVLAAVVRRYIQVDVAGNDDADALVLAAMGARFLGQPIDDMPQTHLRAMEKVAWPVVAA